MDRDDPEVDRLIRHYWSQHTEISIMLEYLRRVHHISCSLTWLKKRLRQLRLFRRGPMVQYSSIAEVQEAIQTEIRGCHKNIGYRQMWRVMQKKYGLTVKRVTVQMLLAILDPVGVVRRKSRRLKRRIYQNEGPDYVWHIDGYDKLKPYGFTIHGCIDGYSRKIIWLKIATTNNDPAVILRHYLLSVLRTKGCPAILRCDKGTENSILASCHMTMRHYHTDNFRGEKSFRYGPSTSNTRIESFWAQLRKSWSDWWINVFKDLIQQGKYNPNDICHRHSLSYTFEHLMTSSLNDFVLRWNTHRIRPTRLAGCPAGVPNDLYSLPSLQGTVSYKKSIDFEAWAHCYIEHARIPAPFYPSEFKDAADAILNRDFNTTQQNITEINAEVIYLHLVNMMIDT